MICYVRACIKAGGSSIAPKRWAAVTEQVIAVALATYHALTSDMFTSQLPCQKAPFAKCVLEHNWPVDGQHLVKCSLRRRQPRRCEIFISTETSNG
mmetsp:Transcript_32960/g.86595  ORF Transcript_32960/g.86595 Transcript_32960/m.86595 type:complete len:96 (+) Transcript_32960:437-724(+)